MIIEYVDTLEESAHDAFQAWRTSNPEGLFLTLVSQASATLHGAHCQHLGSGPPYFSSCDGLGTLTLYKKICGAEEELRAWAGTRNVEISPCRDCLRDGLLAPDASPTMRVAAPDASDTWETGVPSAPSPRRLERLDLPAGYRSRMLRIFASAAHVVKTRYPEGYCMRLDGGLLRLNCGRLTVTVLEHSHVWLALDATDDVAHLSTLRSWHPDEAELRPKNAGGVSFPQYVNPPSVNGYYLPQHDPLGLEWAQLERRHHAYLRLAALQVRAPDPRTGHDPRLESELQARLDAEDPDGPDLPAAVRRAWASGVEGRRPRLRVAPKFPEQRVRETRGFDRNPDVIAEVLWRALGFCERCRKPAPFVLAVDGTPYLEVHYKVLLADGGPDTVENAVALCPNCHRLLHFG